MNPIYKYFSFELIFISQISMANTESEIYGQSSLRRMSTTISIRGSS